MRAAHVWDMETGKRAGKPLSHPNRVFSVEFSPDGPNVVGFDLDRAALTEVFGPDTGVCFPDSPGFFAGLLQCTIAESGSREHQRQRLVP